MDTCIFFVEQWGPTHVHYDNDKFDPIKAKPDLIKADITTDNIKLDHNIVQSNKGCEFTHLAQLAVCVWSAILMTREAH